MSGMSTRGSVRAPLLALVLAVPGAAFAQPDEAELRVFRDTAERYTSRMREFHADVSHIVDVTESSYIIELTGDTAKLDAFIETVSAKRVLEVVRSGALGILRGTKALRA